MNFCPPTSVITGLSDLPVDYVYYNGVVDRTNACEWCSCSGSGSCATTKMFTHEGIEYNLNGKELYLWTMKIFVPGYEDPQMLHDLGMELVDENYREAVEVAKNYTEIYDDDDRAIEEFNKILWDQDQFLIMNHIQIMNHQLTLR
eukprot:UN05026